MSKPKLSRSDAVLIKELFALGIDKAFDVLGDIAFQQPRNSVEDRAMVLAIRALMFSIDKDRLIEFAKFVKQWETGSFDDHTVT